MVNGMKKIILAVMLFAISSAANAETGTVALPFLKLAGGARSTALAGAYSAIGDNAESVFYNPASTVYKDRSEVSFSHTMWLEDMSIEQMAYVQPISPFVSFIAGVSALVIGSMDNTDEDGNSSGSFNSMDIAAGAGFSYIMTKRLYVAGKINFYSQTMDTESAGTLGADFGLVLRGDYLRYAVSAMNLGNQMKLGTQSFPLPRIIRGGISREIIKGLKTGIEAINYNDNGTRFAAGAEYSFSLRPEDDEDQQKLSFRAGYASGRDKNAGSGLTGGIGFLTSDLSVDYAFMPYGDLGSAHRFSVSLYFGEKRENTRETYEFHYRSREENRLQTENKLFKKGKERVADVPITPDLEEYKPIKEAPKIRDFTW